MVELQSLAPMVFKSERIGRVAVVIWELETSTRVNASWPFEIFLGLEVQVKNLSRLHTLEETVL